jgi:hypothetical protein
MNPTQKLLIDGSIFSQIGQEKSAECWRQIIPRLPLRLRGHEIYYLNRSGTPDFPDTKGLINLFAPKVDFGISAIEDRRLAALCRELGVQVFLSTFNTSAGAEVNTLCVEWDFQPDYYQKKPDVLAAKQRCLRMASSILALRQNEVSLMCRTLNILMDRILCIYTDGDTQPDWTVISNTIAKIILQLPTCTLDPEVSQIRAIEDKKTRAKAESLAPIVYGAASLSPLNRLIPPEIKDTELYKEIQNLSAGEDIKTILEIGSSAGDGSTEAFVLGIMQNPNRPTLYCIEASGARFLELKERYSKFSFIKGFNVSSIPVEKFPTEEDIVNFYFTTRSKLNDHPIKDVLEWYRQDIEYLRIANITTHGIEHIRRQENITCFDMVLIDGSQFAGSAELDEIYGARYILLDDVNTFNNYKNYHRLMSDANYSLYSKNWEERNGYAIFKLGNDVGLSEEIIRKPAEKQILVLEKDRFTHYFFDIIK